MKSKPRTIDEYLAGVNADQRVALEKLRKTIRAAAPEVEECISYGIPAFRLNGRSLVFFGAWANHCSFYPGNSATLRKFQSDPKGFQTTKGTIRFSPDNPLPPALVKKTGQSTDSGEPDLTSRMPKFSPRRLAQRSYEAFAAGDRKFFEQHLAEDFTFSSPLDVGLDRAGYFARCWPGAGHDQKFNFLRLIEHDDEVVVTYEMTKPNGEKGRNTEIMRIKDNKIVSVEVYFGWDLLPNH